MNLIKLANINQIPPNSMKSFIVSGKKVSVINLDGEFFAVDDICTHEHCSLSGEGFLDGNIIICGCHGATFDATNGKVMSLPATSDLTSYKTKVQGEDLFIEM